MRIYLHISENTKNERLLVISNFYGKETNFVLPDDISLDSYKSRVIIANYPDWQSNFRKIKLRPYESVVYHLVKDD